MQFRFDRLPPDRPAQLVAAGKGAELTDARSAPIGGEGRLYAVAAGALLLLGFAGAKLATGGIDALDGAAVILRGAVASVALSCSRDRA